MKGWKKQWDKEIVDCEDFSELIDIAERFISQAFHRGEKQGLSNKTIFMNQAYERAAKVAEEYYGSKTDLIPAKDVAQQIRKLKSE